MDQNSYKEFYEGEAEKYLPADSQYYRHDRFYNVRLFAGRPAESGLRILDVGCGNGYQLGPLAARHEVHGLDVSEANVRKAAGAGIKAVLHDVETRFPYENGYFDVVVCSEILEHLFFPERVIGECSRVLKPGGVFIVTVPNLYCFRNRVSMLIGRGAGFIEYPKNTIHIRFFSIPGMKRLLAEGGFSVAGVLGQHFAMNFDWPFRLIWYLHGGNRGLRFLIRLLTLGRKVPEIPGQVLQFHLVRFLGKIFPRLSPGLLFDCRKAGVAKKN
ncbi:MAG: class I SAM-dependent methyltransferase [Elusimicrobiales bacterium]